MRNCGAIDVRQLRWKDKKERGRIAMPHRWRHHRAPAPNNIDINTEWPRPQRGKAQQQSERASCRNELSLRSVRLGLARLAHELLEGLGIDVVDAEEARDAFREVAAVPRLEHALRTEHSAYEAPSID